MGGRAPVSPEVEGPQAEGCGTEEPRAFALALHRACCRCDRKGKETIGRGPDRQDREDDGSRLGRPPPARREEHPREAEEHATHLRQPPPRPHPPLLAPPPHP